MKCCLVLALLTIATGAALGTKEAVPERDPVKKPHEKDGEHNPHYDHEAVIGSRRTEEEFDDMSPEEAKQKLTLLVAQHDSNNDQIITKYELVAWLLKSFKNLDEEDAMEKFNEEDVDIDNKVAWKEYLKSQFGYELADVEEFKKLLETAKDDPQHKETFDVLELINEEEEKFMAADSNSDGFLELDEFRAFYHPYEHPQMHDVEIKRVMKNVDKDKDGIVSKKEYVGETTDKESIIAEEENFKAHDKNGDGKLDAEEIKVWVIQGNQHAALEEADHLITLADENKNNELSLTEIVDHYDDFVGSQATDYGRHLEDEL